ncbi:MAG: DUF302 domain-containing protein [Robiginitomaculum sp.]|nr:DUF302 domain-containing protein [Robiginitomaculum sp.]
MIGKFITASVAVASLVACTPPQDPALNDSIVTIKSNFDVETTMDRLEQAVQDKSLRIFARIDHAANAKAMDLQMRPSTLLIFGSPKIGSPLMREAPTMGLDLPVKALVYEGTDGQVYLSYNNPAYLKQRHNVVTNTAPLDKMTKALAGLSTQATSE